MQNKISILLNMMAVFTGVVLVLGILNSCAGTREATHSGGTVVKEFTPSMSFEEYQKRYNEYYGDATAQMAEEGNPAEFLLDDGKDLANTVAGTKGKSCASCHGKDAVKLKGVAATFPKYNADLKGIMTLPLQINLCRKNAMGAEPLKYESYDQLSLTMYIRSLSNGMPIHVSIDGPARPFYEKGKAFYYKRQGQWNFSCAICHVKYAGYRARANLLSNNKHHVDHWPCYRLKWGKTGSLHRRFRGCMKNMRAKPLAYQSEDYRNMELYLTHIANGEPIQVPGMRM
ncbi:MAG: sulfur oxidation c-type cytochrome SoxA [Deltaproteobacteria bacterium]|nr:sulfur oxidation c-type cytochrome SoxA [Deltaproteobacteria bacterium]